MSFKWIPGVGPSKTALQTMREGIPRPEFAMGEAWFIGDERKIFDDLIQKPITELTDTYLGQVLYEISSGIKCFGHLKEWDYWFPYLLPRLIGRWSDRYTSPNFMEQVITTFICLYPSDICGRLLHFRDEVIATLPHSIMAGHLWEDWADAHTSQKTKIPGFLRSGFGHTWATGKADEYLSAVLIFCLKYLKPDEIESWVHSLLVIEDAYWRTALIIWLSAIAEIFEEPEVTYPMIATAPVKIVWHYSFILDPRTDTNRIDTASTAGENLLPLENRKTFLRAIRTTLTEEIYLSWLDSISAEPHLSNLLSHHLNFFFDRFVRV